jgi:hypothetical protein
MKITHKSVLSWSAALLLLAASAIADPVTAWTQLGFTIELSSGVLNVTPVANLTTASADWQDASTPWTQNESSDTTNGFTYASATAGSSLATGLATNTDNYFLLDAFATTEALLDVSGHAEATVLSLYDLSFSGVEGSFVTLTLTPLFYSNSVPGAGSAPALNYAYGSAFLSLGDLSFFSFQDYSDSSGYAEFAPLTLQVGANDTVQLNAAITASVGVPDTAGTLGLLGVGLLFLVGLQRKLGTPRHAVMVRV